MLVLQIPQRMLILTLTIFSIILIPNAYAKADQIYVFQKPKMATNIIKSKPVKVARKINSQPADSYLWNVYWDEAIGLYEAKDYSKCVEILKTAIGELKPSDKNTITESTELLENCYLKLKQLNNYFQSIKIRLASNAWKKILKDAYTESSIENHEVAKFLFEEAIDEIIASKTIGMSTKQTFLKNISKHAAENKYTSIEIKVSKILAAQKVDETYIDDYLCDSKYLKGNRYSTLLKQIDQLCHEKNWHKALTKCHELISSPEIKNKSNELTEDILFRALDRECRIYFCSNLKPSEEIKGTLKAELNRLATKSRTEKSSKIDRLHIAVLLSDMGLIQLKEGSFSTGTALIKKSHNIFSDEIEDQRNPLYIKSLLDLAKAQLLQSNESEANALKDRAYSLARNNNRIGQLAITKTTVQNTHSKLVGQRNVDSESDWAEDSSSENFKQSQPNTFVGMDRQALYLMQKAPLIKPPLKPVKVEKSDFKNWLEKYHPEDALKSKSSEIIEVKSKWDDPSIFLRDFNFSFKRISFNELGEKDLSKTKVIIVTGDHRLPKNAVLSIRQFVAKGGYLITTNQSLNPVVDTAFPGIAETSNTIRGIKFADAVVVTKDLNFVKNLPEAGSWRLPANTNIIKIKRPKAIQVLVRSRLLSKHDPSGFGILAFTFSYYGGRVLHLLGNLGKYNDSFYNNSIPDPAPGIDISMRQALAANFIVEAIKSGRK